MSAPAYDHSGIVQTVDFDYPEEHEEAPEQFPDESAIRQECILTLLRLLCAKNASPKQIGQRVLLLGYLIRVADCKNQRQLAKRLKVTPARVSQILNAAKRDFSKLAKGDTG